MDNTSNEPSDPTFAPYLHAAVLLGMCLVVRGRTVGDAGGIESLRGIEGCIEAEATRLAKMEKLNAAISRNSEQMGDEIRKAQAQLGRLLKTSRSALQALNIELTEEEVKRESPIMLDGDSLAHATAALPPMQGEEEQDEAEPASGGERENDGEVLF